MSQGQVLPRNGISLNGEDYEFASTADAETHARARVWTIIPEPQATKRVQRPDVLITGEAGVITWDDWSGGFTGENENLPGCVYFTEGAHGTVPGSLLPVWTQTYSAIQAIETIQEGDPVLILEWNSSVIVVMGRYVYTWIGTTLTQDKDFTTGVVATHAIIHNNELVVGFDAAIKIQKRNTAGTWTAATDNTYADFFAEVENRLYRTTVGQISNIGPTDNPLTLANWSTGLVIGTSNDPTLSNSAITALNAVGIRIGVSRSDGFYLGDASLVFPNVIPMGGFSGDYRNGEKTMVRGGEVFYPHARGLIRYVDGENTEIGLGRVINSANVVDQIPGTRVLALATDGSYIWAVTEISGQPQALPTGVRFTQNNGSSYTNGTANTTDSSLTTVLTTSGWDTLVNGDFLLVGYSAQFYGVEFQFAVPNKTATVLAGQYSTGAGTWANFPITSAFHDGTKSPNNTALANSGLVTWANHADLSAWVSATYDGTAAFWVRFDISALSSTPMSIAEIRVLTSDHRAHLVRGRSRRQTDLRRDPFIWEPYSFLQGAASPTALVKVSPSMPPHNTGGALLVSSRNRLFTIRLPMTGNNSAPHSVAHPGGATVVSARHDAGMPEINKQWLSLTVKGRTLSADRDIALEYRVNENTTWVSASASITSSPTTIALTGVTGYSIQWRLTFNAFTSDQFTEVNEIEARFRTLDTTKDVYTAMLDLHEGQAVPPDIQYANLKALENTAAVTLIDPLNASVTVNVREVKVRERYHSERGYPALMCELTLQEV